MKAKVTVIIPCYNQGHFLSDALASLAQCDPDLYLVTIVDDGSTDPATLLFLEELDQKSFNIIHQPNKGLSGARNTGIKHANTDFVLMLDADNKIRPSFLEKGTAILERDTQIAVVYGDGQFFGDLTGTRKQAQFNLQKQMLVNYIDACALIRKSVFEDVGDFDENMKDGWEDWEMWLRVAFRGYKFHYLDEVVFDYRIRKESMSKQVYDNKARTNNIENYVYGKYPDKMGISYVVDFMVDRFRRNPFLFIFKLFIRTYFPGYYDRLLQKNKIRNGL
jgi:glycosyltransferase involved in cell wall biosynthesis